METYIIRVNGIEYEVEVEKKDPSKAAQAGRETGGTPKQTGPANTPKAAAAKKPAAEGTPVASGTAGKVWKITASEGAALKKGDSILILEAMKMEIPVVMPSDGTLVSIAVSEGDSVESGQTVATIA